MNYFNICVLFVLGVGAFSDHVRSKRYTFGIYKDSQGDLRLTDEQKEILFNSGNLEEYASYFWENGVVPYQITKSKFVDLLEPLFEEFEKHTCVKFVKRTDEENYVEMANGRVFTKGSRSEKCDSYLGNVRMGKQTLNLYTDGCTMRGTVLHLLGHTLGLVHQHQMSNRDKYVRINETTMDKTYLDQFTKYAENFANLYQVGYDFSSVMHYSLTAYAKRYSAITMETDDPSMKQHVGVLESRFLSFGDVKTLNRMYKCADKCEDKDCPEPGFVDKNCECVTPEEYHQKICQDRAEKADWCVDLKKSGWCHPQDDIHHWDCPKSCGFCPKYLPASHSLQ